MSLLASPVVFSQGPNDTGAYYQTADGKKGAELKTALFAVISPHTLVSYTPGVWNAINSYDIRPDGYIIPDDAVRIHGITTQRAMEEGRALAAVVDEFMADFDQATFIVGHNIDFDKKILGAELIRLHRPDVMNSKRTYCTMQAGTDFCRIPGKYGYKWPKLQELHIKLFGHDFDGAHNAMSDIEATQECFWELRRRRLI